MRAIDKKLYRSLWHMRLQAMAIALVIVGGVGVFIMSLSTLDSLRQTQQVYYRDYRFANVFSMLKRAPVSMLARIADIPGVEEVEGRVLAYVNLQVSGFNDPVSGQLLSLPRSSDPYSADLNQVYLYAGAMPAAERDNQVLVSKEFAMAHGLQPGDSLGATINGRHQTLVITGLALSPEYIFQIAPGAMFPDYARYGVLWMARTPLANAFDMQGAFNEVSLTLRPGASSLDVIDQLDELLKPYGSEGAFDRSDQLSNRFLTAELSQLETMARVFPAIFFGVAAFLLNMVISRLIGLEREQIGTLKAFGYSNLEVGWHYLKFALLIVLLGVVLGLGAGILMGRGMSAIYRDLYSLPFLTYVLRLPVILAAAGICAAVAALGTLQAVRRAVQLPPAEAMRPEPPIIYTQTQLALLKLQSRLSQSNRMILRRLERHRVKSLMTMLGIAMACGVMMVGGFQRGSIDYMVFVQFQLSQRDDLTVLYTESTSRRSEYSLRSLPGVESVEGYRLVPVRLRHQHYTYRTGISATPAASQMLRMLDDRLQPLEIPDSGILLTDYLAGLLHVQQGSLVQVEILEGERRTRSVRVADVVNQYVGVGAYMQLEALNRLLGEGPVISGVRLAVDDQAQASVYARLKDMPRVAGVVEQGSAVDAFYATLAEVVLFFTSVSTLLGASIAFGVVYNAMRIALSERQRELASLRVLGFRVSEIAYILLGELALLVLVALPVGLLFGFGLCAFLAYQFNTDLYRIPLLLDRGVFSMAALVVLLSALVSALLLLRQLLNLNLVDVLKTRD